MINVREVEIKSTAKDAGSRALGPWEREGGRGSGSGGKKPEKNVRTLVEREFRLLRPHEIRVIGEV